MVTVQPPVPLQPPLQPPKRERRLAFAVRVTWVPTVKAEEQDDPQSIPAGELVTVPPPKPLFETRTLTSRSFSISPDGKRFLMVQLGDDSGVTSLNVVLNWHAGVKR